MSFNLDIKDKNNSANTQVEHRTRLRIPKVVRKVDRSLAYVSTPLLLVSICMIFPLLTLFLTFTQLGAAELLII